MVKSPLKILYLVHDISDPAVKKRTVMLGAGGAVVTIAGFRRTAEAVNTIADRPVIHLGQTYNGGFVQRIWSVLREVALLSLKPQMTNGFDVIIARNLEMLAIAVRARRLSASPVVIVYESLDIHRLLLNGGIVGRVMRGVEGWLSKRACLLITSSPAFVAEYFDKLSQVRLPVQLVENKVYSEQPLAAHIAPRPDGKPWRIGWFGAIRCRKSLMILSDLAQKNAGKIEVIIRGRPAYDQLPDFDKIVSQIAGLSFVGAYKNPDDLAMIYQDVHFTWAIDMFEEGQNSSWLLPNRLYEGGLFHAVPLALATVETGKYLKRLGIGVTLDEPLAGSLQKFFDALTLADYRILEAQSAQINEAQWLDNKDNCVALVELLARYHAEGVRS